MRCSGTEWNAAFMRHNGESCLRPDHAMTAAKINWPEPPSDWALGAGEIHVWTTSLEPGREALADYSSMLSPDETVRAGRFHFERDRNRFIAGRGWLRAVLARYWQRHPGRLRFAYNSRGKPALADSPGTLHFNLAHCEGLALLAVTRTCEVGIDVERVRPLSDADSIAGRFFSASESEGLKGLPDVQKPRAFFNLWTRKEAWLKATGDGISDSLNQVEVSFLAGEPARLIRLFGKTEGVQNWTLRELVPAADFVG